MIITRILRTMKSSRTRLTITTARILRTTKTILRTAPAAMHRIARRITTNNKGGAVIWLYRSYYAKGDCTNSSYIDRKRTRLYNKSMEKMSFIVPCHFGMETVLKREIINLGYERESSL